MGNTPVLGLPYPEDTDPLGNAAAAVESLATAVESVHPVKFRRGLTTATTDASGDVTITHGLGSTPAAVIVSNANNSLTVTTAPHTLGATTFKVRYRSSTTGATVGAGASVTTAWLALA